MMTISTEYYVQITLSVTKNNIQGFISQEIDLKIGGAIIRAGVIIGTNTVFNNSIIGLLKFQNS